MDPAYRYRATCERVVDGDTYHLRIDLGFHVAVTVPVRLRGVNCPEMNTPEGKAARAWVMMVLKPMRPLMIESYRDQQSFARWICDVWVGDQLLADLIVEAGHGTRI